jgi:hypothetical protein
MLSFISAILFYSIDRILKHKGLYLSKSLDTLKILHSRIYNNKILPSCPTKKVNDIFKALKIKLPDYIKV